jgi:hypothetical protein
MEAKRRATGAEERDRLRRGLGMHASRRQKLHPRCGHERWTKGLRFVETVLEEDVKACVQYAIDTIDAEEIHVYTSVS